MHFFLEIRFNSVQDVGIKHDNNAKILKMIPIDVDGLSPRKYQLT